MLKSKHEKIESLEISSRNLDSKQIQDQWKKEKTKKKESIYIHETLNIYTHCHAYIYIRSFSKKEIKRGTLL